jgi:hypothetical protein
MGNDSDSSMSRWRSRLNPPPPDTEEGGILAIALAAALVYILLFIADYSAMTSIAFGATALSLTISVLSAYALATMLGNDIANYQRLELELSRTVLAYASSGTPPASDAPLAGVWRAHVAASEESRRMSRAHAYALGLFSIAALASVAAVLLAGLGTVTSTQNVRGLAMLVEWVAFTFLVVGAASVVVSVGYSESVTLYEATAPRRWRRNSGRQAAVDSAVGEIGWLAEFSRGARESRMSSRGPGTIPSWRE